MSFTNPFPRPPGLGRTIIEGESMTRQDHKDECDIHHIMRRFDRTGVLSHVSKHIAQYVDVSELHTFEQVIQLQREASAAFLELPSRIREQFNNDPAIYLDFIASASEHELTEAGLLKPKDKSSSGDGSPTSSDTPSTPPTPPTEQEVIT